MIIKRVHLLSFISACLLGTSTVLSNSSPLSVAAGAGEGDVVRLAMLQDASQDRQSKAITSTPTSQRGTIDRTGINRPAMTPEPPFSEQELLVMRALFVQAEEAIENRDEAAYAMLTGQLEDYPLYPYLRYQWLRKHLDREADVREYLQVYANTRYAPLLKRAWLTHLARRGQWETFLDFYETTSDNRLQCYYHLALFNTGEAAAALEGAKLLWTAGYSQPDTCDPLFGQLKASSHFTPALFWQRFDAAIRNNKTGLARYVKRFMPANDQKVAELWLRLHRDPERHLPELIRQSDLPQAPSMFTDAMNRLAGRDVSRAIELWESYKDRFDISEAQLNKLERRLAMNLAFRNDTDAFDRLGRLNESDYTSKAWRIRVALYEQNWPRVITAIHDLGPANRRLEKWQYWLARAYDETGRQAEADELFSALAGKRDFYGYLAAERMNRGYQLLHDPVDVTERDIAEIGYREEFLAAHELLTLDRDNLAKLQWWHALRQLDPGEIPAAAKLAQQWDWHEIPILTIAKVKYWDDIDLRFPMSYADDIRKFAMQHDLDPVILFGLIRRESVFNRHAHSSAGARGLMQLMPRTARQVARDLNERWQGRSALYDPEQNLRYGSYYYSKLLRQFNGHYALALAAYNAGPHRVKQWLPENTSMPADIWIETIPFRETRNYVTTVLVYAMIYQQILESDQLRMSDFTQQVEPLSRVASSDYAVQ